MNSFLHGCLKRFYKNLNDFQRALEAAKTRKTCQTREKTICFQAALCKHICLPRAPGGLERAKRVQHNSKWPLGEFPRLGILIGFRKSGAEGGPCRREESLKSSLEVGVLGGFLGGGGPKPPAILANPKP